MAVLPESMAQLPREDVGKSLKVLEDYVRYMSERMEFSVSGLNKNVGELTALQEQLAALEARVQALETPQTET